MLGLAQTQTLTPASQRLFAPGPASHPSSLVTHYWLRSFLIATQVLDIELTHSQQTRKHFLIATIPGVYAPTPHCNIATRAILTATKMHHGAGKIAHATLRGSRAAERESRFTIHESRFTRHRTAERGIGG
jgi:hypothetical protein